MPAPRPGGSSRSGAQPDKQQEPAVSGRPSGATAAAGNPSSATWENVAAIRDRASRLGCAANLKPIGEWPAGAGKGIITAPVSRTAGHAWDRDHARHRPVLTAPGRIPGCPGNRTAGPVNGLPGGVSRYVAMRWLEVAQAAWNDARRGDTGRCPRSIVGPFLAPDCSKLPDRIEPATALSR